MFTAGPALIILQNPNDHPLPFGLLPLECKLPNRKASTALLTQSDTLVLVSSPWEGLHAETEGHFRQQE